MKRLLLILLLIFHGSLFSTISCAQNQDMWQWTTISVDKKISPKVTVFFDEELRLFNNVSQINLNYTNFGVSYSINKNIKISGVYRWIEKSQPNGTYSSRHRFYNDISLKYKINPLTFAYRSRLQTQVRDVYSSDNGTVPESYWRHKFDLKFDLNKPYTPYIAAEFRYQFNNNRIREANNEFDRGRYYIGCDYKITGSSTFGLYYMIQREFNINDPETDYVLGITYNLSR